MSKKQQKIPSFLEKLDKSAAKMTEVSSSAGYPEFFFDSGSCIINKIMSGRYEGAYGQGRLSMIAGPSNSGKSFLLANAVKKALDAGYGAFLLDSENALDEVYLSNIGVDIDNPLLNYKGVSSISDAKQLISKFFEYYREEPEAQRIPYLIGLDSLDMLRTDIQVEKDTKGQTHNDMGQHIKQLSEFQSNIMHQIKNLPIAFVATKQPYVNQDPHTNKREPYVITEKLRFPHTQILSIKNRLIKDNTTNTFEGIYLEVYGFKTRFTKPYQKCVIEVPYDSGIDWYSGVLEAAEGLGIVKRNGSWYTFGDTKFQRNKFDEVKEELFNELKKIESKSALMYEESDDKDENQ